MYVNYVFKYYIVCIIADTYIYLMFIIL